MSLVTTISNTIGVSEPAIKLLITVYSGYPLALIHRLFPYKKYISLQYAYFTISSLCMLYWNYGFDVYHSLLSLSIQWLIFKVFAATSAMVGISFIFQMGYLVYGYLVYSTSGYDINWCMPQCILTLRMIGLAWDVYDGHQKHESLNKDQQERGIKDIPSLIEIFGFNYFYGGYIVGPQFPLQRLRSLLNGELTDTPGGKPNSLFPGFRRCASGTLMLACQAYLASLFNPLYYTTIDFQTSPFLYKAGYIAITGHVTLFQYVAIWVANEGSCIISGLGYKTHDGGRITWDAVGNVKLRGFVSATSFQDVINCFNINTNGWVLRYVFKRLRFVGIRLVSHLSALYFLALWHGLHEGYFTCFTFEFLVMTVEKPMSSMIKQLSIIQYMKSHPILSLIPTICGWVYVHMLLGYAVIDFALLKWSIYSPVYTSVYYYGHLFFMILFVLLKIQNSFKNKEE
ncbi:lysophospholipid acyltransferase 5-like [Ciona intestinalis]